MKVKAIKTKLFKKNDDLFSFVISNIKKVKENSVIVITSKIVALSEGRIVMHDGKESHDIFKEKIIKSESEYMLKTTHTWLTIKDGMVMANAGIDESNSFGGIVLLPKDSFKSAKIIREKLKKYYGVKNLGILITDSRLFPLRAGIVGAAIGYAGFHGVRDYRGTPDIFGRNLKLSRTDVADSLATSAVLEMGEGREQQPLAIITEASIVFSDKINKKELLIDIHDDLYMPLFKNAHKLPKKHKRV